MSRCTFEVQVQGKFKRLPCGEIFVGADCQTELSLGVVTRAFCKGVLRFVATMVNNLCYSFGESPTAAASAGGPGKDTAAAGHQIAHLVAPIFATSKSQSTPSDRLCGWL